MQFKSTLVLALAASASAFAPATFGVRTSTSIRSDFVYGDYDDKMFDNTAKKDVYGKWDPSSPRNGQNFNPFETFKGNTPDASGVYPGESFYKDPQRGDASYAIMQAEKAEADARAANPKAGENDLSLPGTKNGP